MPKQDRPYPQPLAVSSAVRMWPTIDEQGGQWQADFGVINGRRLRQRFRTKSEAQAWAHDQKRDIWPIMRPRGRSWEVDLGTFDGRRVMRSFRSFDQAQAWAEQKRIQRRNQGIQSLSLSDADRMDAVRALSVLNGDVSAEDISGTAAALTRAAAFWMQHNGINDSEISLEDCIQKYVAYKKRLNRRPTTIRELGYKLNSFARSFRGRKVHTITRREIREWLQLQTSSLANWRKYRHILHAFFKYALAEEFIAKNPVVGIDVTTAEVVDAETEIYTVDEVERMLRAAETSAPDIVAALAIGFFAGLRPAEVLRLQWQDVNLDTRRIRVTKQTSKRKRTRVVEISDNLAAWLSAYGRESGPVCASEAVWRNRKTIVMQEAGIKKWIHDGLRHAFGSYHLERHQNPSRTAHQMGHRDTRVMYDHYIAAVEDPKDAERYWRLMPTGTDLPVPGESSTDRCRI